MPQFTISSVVNRMITDKVTLRVNANSVDEAKTMALQALDAYPEAHNFPEINYMYIDDREYHEPSSIELEGVSA